MNISVSGGLNSVVNMVNNRAMQQNKQAQNNQALTVKTILNQQSKSRKDDAVQNVATESNTAQLSEYDDALIEAARLYEQEQNDAIRKAQQWFFDRPYLAMEFSTPKIDTPEIVAPIDDNHQTAGKMIDAIETAQKLVQLMERYEGLVADESFSAEMHEAFQKSIDFYSYNARKNIFNGIVEFSLTGLEPDRTTSETKIYEQLSEIARDLGKSMDNNASSNDLFSVMENALAKLYAVNSLISPDNQVARGDKIDPLRGQLSAYDLERFDWMNQGIINNKPIDMASADFQEHMQRIKDSGLDFSPEAISSGAAGDYINQYRIALERVDVSSTYHEFVPGQSREDSDFEWAFREYERKVKDTLGLNVYPGDTGIANIWSGDAIKDMDINA